MTDKRNRGTRRQYTWKYRWRRRTYGGTRKGTHGGVPHEDTNNKSLVVDLEYTSKDHWYMARQIIDSEHELIQNRISRYLQIQGALFVFLGTALSFLFATNNGYFRFILVFYIIGIHLLAIITSRVVEGCARAAKTQAFRASHWFECKNGSTDEWLNLHARIIDQEKLLGIDQGEQKDQDGQKKNNESLTEHMSKYGIFFPEKFIPWKWLQEKFKLHELGTSCFYPILFFWSWIFSAVFLALSPIIVSIVCILFFNNPTVEPESTASDTQNVDVVSSDDRQDETIREINIDTEFVHVKLFSSDKKANASEISQSEITPK